MLSDNSRRRRRNRSRRKFSPRRLSSKRKSFLNSARRHLHLEPLEQRIVLDGFGFDIGGLGNEVAYDIALDAQNNFYITGNFQAGTDFDPSPGVVTPAVNGSQDAYVAKYNAQGELQWVDTFTTTADADLGSSMVVDAAGENVFFVHESAWSPARLRHGSWDPVTSNMQWTDLGTILGHTWADVRALDDEGDVYVASHGSSSFSVSKYDVSAGNWAWQRPFVTGSNSYPFDLEVGQDGNLLVTGQYTGTLTVPANPPGAIPPISGGNGYLVKLDSATGYALWAHGWTEKTAGVYEVAGGDYFMSSGVNDSGVQLTRLTLDASGEPTVPVWSTPVRTTNGSASSGLSVDAGGNLYVSGTFLAGFNDRELFVARVSPDDGNVDWQVTTSSSDQSNMRGGAKVTPHGDLYMAAYFRSDITIPLNSSGTPQQTQTVDGYQDALVWKLVQARIHGQKFENVDGDGERDPGEPGLDGWTVELIDTASGLVVATQVTHSTDLDNSGAIDPETESGLYSFTGLDAGDYEVREVLQESWQQTFPKSFGFGAADSDPTGYQSQWSAAADFDGDGDLDLAVANRGGNVSVLLNDGTGRFTQPNSNDAVGTTPSALALGDVDLDGDTDIVTVNEDSANISVLFNLGDIDDDDDVDFGGRINYPAGNYPYLIGLGDLDGDGDLDLVTGNAGGQNKMTVLINRRVEDGSFSFASGVHFGIGVDARFGTLADVDNDADLDAIIAGAGSHSVAVMLNNGSASFSAPVTSPYGVYGVGSGSHPVYVTAGDLDGDGDVDLAVPTQYSGVTLFSNDGAGGFSDVGTVPPASSLTFTTIADVDGDGDQDLIIPVSGGTSFQVQIRFNDGAFLFDTFNVLTLDHGNPALSVAADLDGDGDLDLAVPHWADSGRVSVLLNQTGSHLVTLTSGQLLDNIDFGNQFNGTVAETGLTIDGSGNLVIADINGGNADDTLTVKTDGTDVIVTDPANLLVTAITGATGSETNTVNVPLTSFTGKIIVDSLAGDDTLTVDFSTGNFTRQIDYLGGENGATGDQVILQGGGTFASAQFDYTDASSGEISISGNAKITYADLEPIDSLINATDVTLNFSTASESISIASAGAGRTAVGSTAGESTEFNNPTGALTINAGDTGADAIEVTGLGTGFSADLTINGQGGADAVSFRTNPTDTGGGALTVTADLIEVDADILTGGGALSLLADNGVAFTANGSIDTQSGSTAAVTITVDNAISAGGSSNGTLDPGFGGDGKVTTDFGSIEADTTFAVAVQSDGKIIAGGASGGVFALARYNSSGSLDTTFDGDGLVTTNLTGTSAVQTISSLAIQSDGKIVAGGTIDGEQLGLVRYNVNGTLDTSFGGGDGIVVSNLIGGSEELNGLKLQSDGKIVVAGTADGGDLLVARYTSAGDLDTSFGFPDGFSTYGPELNVTYLGYDVVVQSSSGRIVVGGTRLSLGPVQDFVLVGFESDGDLDTAFGTGGVVQTDMVTGDSPDTSDVVFALALQPDEKIVAVGDVGDGLDIGLARYTVDGALDDTFGSGGIVVQSFGSNTANPDPPPLESARAVALQPDGKIVVVGGFDSDNMAVRRFNSDGSLDTAFGSGGQATVDFGGQDEAFGVAVQSDGGIVAAGYTLAAETQFALARFGSSAAGGLNMASGSSINARGGLLTMTTDKADLNGTLGGPAALVIQPKSADTSIGISGGAGTLQINTNAPQNGFSSITIGDTAAGTGDVDINTATFLDPVTISGGVIHDHAGTDITAPTVTFDGNVSPGQSPGILSISGDFVFAGNDTFTVEIGGTTPGETDSNHDQLSATGSVTIGSNVTLTTSAWNGFTPSPGNSFTIIERTGGSGTFAGLGEGATVSTDFLGSGLDATITYAGGDGDDVVLTIGYPADFRFYVDRDTIGGANNGTSWSNAFTDLQTALLVADAGDEIWVAEGTYYPTDDTDRTISFNLETGVDIFGGFAGTETLREQRDWTTNVTTLSGDIGTLGDTSDNSYHVLYASGVTNVTLDGFTVTAGNAASLQHRYGGGMYNNSSSPTVTNVIFSANSADYTDGNNWHGGGGIYNSGSSPTLTNVIFTGNSADGYLGGGGGIYNIHSSPTLTNVIFTGNSADYGGGIHNYSNSGPTVTNVTFSDNSARLGGGMYNFVVSSNPPVVANSIFWGNTASYGPQIYNDSTGGAVTVDYSIVQGGWGGAGNLNANPQFVDAAGGDLHLLPGSPAIDAGTDVGAPGFDLDYSPRPYEGDGDGTPEYDMGAYEVQNQPPIADAGGPYTIDEGDGLALDASGSWDANLDSLTFLWDVDGDGDYDENVTGEAPTRTWNDLVALGIDNGPYSGDVFVEVSDGTETDTAQVTLTVLDLAPTAAFTWAPEPQDEGSAVQFTDESTSSPDSIVGWSWDFDGDDVA
ncbi:MAG: VCBS repeat-containing protein, partial [Planctomycetes bacterium]|nr:VCBS repeat-containing protein [Planctomycetota bacterium]